ncbi:hypothetical protein RchiOBHm_Chr4g0401551 [Rosa chinensis]|uniref:Uncharacterized protein n=1 Tax=Rosa chinensis TaxID=74649 RepID=A0A2P6QT38_ROSCH|nr:hypothetical protein RchiOBHm_Chr4g0401551 [Rosa chinensis]
MIRRVLGVRNKRRRWWIVARRCRWCRLLKMIMVGGRRRRGRTCIGAQLSRKMWKLVRAENDNGGRKKEAGENVHWRSTEQKDVETGEG